MPRAEKMLREDDHEQRLRALEFSSVGPPVRATINRHANTAVAIDTWVNPLAVADDSTTSDIDILEPDETDGFIAIKVNGVWIATFYGGYNNAFQDEHDAIITWLDPSTIGEPPIVPIAVTAAETDVQYGRGFAVSTVNRWSVTGDHQVPLITQFDPGDGPPIHVYGHVLQSSLLSRTVTEVAMIVSGWPL
jgi:hypothetical protein